MPKKKIATKKQYDPLLSIQNSVDRYINDLECLFELFETVIPLLEKQDDKRKQEIDTFLNDLKKNDQKKDDQIAIFKDINDLKYLFANFNKLGIGNSLFRKNTFISIISRFDELVGDIIRNIHKAYPGRLEKCEKTLTYSDLAGLGINPAIKRIA